MGRLVASLLFVSCVITRSMGHGDHVFNPTTEGGNVDLILRVDVFVILIEITRTGHETFSARDIA